MEMMNTVSRRLRALVFCVLGLTPIAVGQVISPDSAMAPMIRSAASDEQTVSSYFDLRWSSDRLDAQEQLAREAMGRWQEIDWGALDVTGRIDAVLLRHHLEGALHDVDQSRARRAEMLPLMPMLPLIERLERSRANMLPMDLEALAKEIGQMPAEIGALRKRLVKSGGDLNDDSLEVSPTLALRTAGAVGDTLRIFERWNSHYAVYMPEFSWWMDSPFREASRAMREYGQFLRRDLAGQTGDDDDPLVGDPEGRDRLMEALNREMIAYSPEALIEIGERELAWCQEELRKAAREMGLGDDTAAAIERVKERHVPPGEQAVLVTKQAEDAIELMRDRGWVTVPPLCAELWRTTMISTRDQRIWPFAAYNNNAVMVGYATDEMDTEAKMMSMRGNNEHFTRIVVPHELIPGHHLQGFMADRIRTYRQIFSTPFFGEGWALYWEMLLWDEGYARSPEDRVGMLFWRSHRAARIIVSLKFHLGEMPPEEMIEFLIDEVGHERDSATSEVRRYINGMYSPLYQVAYMIGGLQLRALRGETVDSGRMTLLAYHDALLQQNSIPVEMIRAQLLGISVEPDWQAQWRFAD